MFGSPIIEHPSAALSYSCWPQFPLLELHKISCVIVHTFAALLAGEDHKTSVVTDSESATESADSSRVRPSRNPRIFFVAVSDGFGSSVCESIFTYHVTACKRRVWPPVPPCGRLNGCVTAAPPPRCLVGHVTHLAASSNYLKR